MVELKRWVAKDATDHGQIITDADVTNDAIFDRLDSDAQFRAVATQLVQRYGYLVPQMNPDSEQGKEHALLIAERTKWIAQHEEEARAQAHQGNQQNLQTSKGCDPQQSAECIPQPPRGNNYYNNYGNPGEQQQQETQPGGQGANPNQPNRISESLRAEVKILSTRNSCRVATNMPMIFHNSRLTGLTITTNLWPLSALAREFRPQWHNL